MTDQIELFRQRFRESLAVSGKSGASVSRAANMYPTWAKEVFRAKAVTLRLPDRSVLEALANQLDVDVEYLAGEQDTPRRNDGLPAAKQPNMTPDDPIRGRRIPVLGQRDPMGPQGGLVMTNKATAFVFAPPNLVDVLDAYAIYMPDTTMVPRYFAGELLFVNPGKPLNRGDFAAVRLKSATKGDWPRLIVRQISELNARRVLLRQFNPPFDPLTNAMAPDEIELPAADVLALDKIVATGEA